MISVTDSSKGEIMAHSPKHGMLYTLAITLAALAVMIAIIMAATRPKAKAKSRAPFDPLGIKLLGMAPCGSDVLYDATGRKVGRYECTPPISNYGQMSSGVLRRDFVFQIPASAEPVLCLPPQITYSESGELYFSDIGDPFGAEPQVCAQWESGTSVSLAMRLELGMRSPRPTPHVDVAFRYYMGKPAPASCTVRGPFSAGSAYTDPGAPQYTVKLDAGGAASSGNRPQRPIGIRVTVEAKRVSENRPTVIVYDKQGRRHLGRYGGGGWQGHSPFLAALTREFTAWLGLRSRGISRSESYSYEAQFSVPGIGPDSIAAITVNEQPYERIFFNVPLSPHGAREADHMAYYDELAARLGLPPQSKIDAFDPKVSIKVIDLLRGADLQRAAEGLFYHASRDALASSETLQRFRETIDKALGASDRRTQYAGAILEAWAGLPEFLEPALTVMQQERERDELVYPIFRSTSFGSYGVLEKFGESFLKDAPPEQVEHVLSRLIQSEDADSRYWVYSQIAQHPRDPGYKQMFLRLAENETPWIWTEAIVRCPGAISKDFPALRAAGKLSPKTAARLVALGKSQGIPDAEAFAAEADAILSRLLTPELVENSSNRLGAAQEAVVGQIGRRLPPAQAIAIYKDFMSRAVARDLWGMSFHAYECYQKAVIAIVEELVRLGALPGADPRWSKAELDKLNWPEIVQAVESVLKSGQRPGAPQAAGQATTQTLPAK